MEILNYPHPILRFKTKTLKTVDSNIHRCAAEMLETMRAERGVGLSANQVGLPFRMFVAEWEGSEICLLNPVVIPAGKRKSKKEGCLSFPDVYVEVTRPAKCRVKGWALNGDDVDEEINGDLARIVQHENDHLDGMLFIDRLSETQRNARPLVHHLGAMERAWKQYPKEFPADAFKDILREYCGVQ